MNKLSSRLANLLSSGTIITGVDTILKELVENSIDAGATTIRVNLQENGIKKIDIYDNGRGIRESDFENVCKRHFTSKLRDEDEIKAVKTYGFRGEALNSICMYSSLQIATKSGEDDVDIGALLKYDTDGVLVSRIPVAREVGTTVSVTGLFNKYPVRKIEARKNQKSNMQKILNTLYGIALASRKASLSVHCDGRQLFSIKNSLDLNDVITSLFGTKEMMALNSFKNETEEIFKIKIHGKVSKLESGGRAKGDRQFVIFNNRHIVMNSINQTIVDVFRRYIGQFHARIPLFVIFIEAEEDFVDVNVAPNKTKIMLEKKLEANLLEFLRDSMIAHFGNEKRERIIDTSYVNSDFGNSLKSSLNQIDRVSAIPNQDSVSSSSMFSIASSCDSNTSKGSPAVTRVPESPISVKLEQKIDDSPVRRKESWDLNFRSSVGGEGFPGMQTSPVRDGKRKFPQTTQIGFTVKRSPQKTMVMSVDLAAILRERKLSAGRTATTAGRISGGGGEEVVTGFNKDNFKVMSENIIGQFNKGYIICRFEDALWAVDQHAADEKIKFEHFMKNGEGIESQPLFLPQVLTGITAADEQHILENLKSYEKLGFRFRTSDKSETGKSIEVTAKPMIKGKVFEYTDIDNVDTVNGNVSVSSDLPNPRVSRIERAFATMACRAAVKFGDGLKMNEMKHVLSEMTKLQNPFLCPHGRPTLMCLSDISRDGSQNSR